MMRTKPELLRLSGANFLFSTVSPPSSLNFAYRPTYPCSAHRAWIIAQLSEELAVTAAAALPEVGPIELPSSISSLLTASDEPTTLQTTTSILLTAAFTIFLFRSLRRRAKIAKQTRMRSSGVKNAVKEEALKRLKMASIRRKSPASPDQALLGAFIAAAFGVLLYKLTTTIEYNLNHQVLSNNYSVRQITMTIRSMINGMCYLATFVFGFNSLGLFLYSGQLALNSIADVTETPFNVNTPTVTCSTDDQTSDETQK